MENDYKHKLLGIAISSIRKRLGVKGKTVAEQTGLTAASISKIENGGIKPTAIQLLEICKAMNVSVSEVEETYVILKQRYDHVYAEVGVDYLTLSIVHGEQT